MNDTMTKQERAVIIAQDVLEWLTAKRMRATPMKYCILGEPAMGSLQAALVKMKQPCLVCALGALFIGSVDKFNQFQIDSLYDTQYSGGKRVFGDEELREHLDSTFTRGQMSLMEHAFECWISNLQESDGNSVEALTTAGHWGRQYSDPTQRLEAICHNLIENKGVFIP